MPDHPRVLHISPSHPELCDDDAAQAAHALFLGARSAGLEADFLACCQPGTDQALFKPGAVITGFDGRPHEYLFLPDSLEQVWHRNLNLRTLTCFAEFLQDLRPQVVHFHHFKTLGLDLFLVARRSLPEARLVLTLHDFHGICRADGEMVRPKDGTLCERASQVRCHQCFPETSPEMFRLREDWVKHAFSAMDAFIAPTEFVRRRYLAWGLPAEKVHVVPDAHTDLTLSPDRAMIPPRCAAEPANRFGVLGAPLDEAALCLLLDALEIYGVTSAPPIIVELSGADVRQASNACRERLERCFAAPVGLQPVRLRRAGGDGRAALMACVDWVLVPSAHWEACGRMVSAAFMSGKPPICGNIGGLAERVRHDTDGLLYEAGDPASLAAALKRATTEEGLRARLIAAHPRVPKLESVVQAHQEVYGA